MIEFLLSWITTPQYLWSFMTLLSFISFWIIILLPFAIINSIKEIIDQWKEIKLNSKYKINEKVKYGDLIGIVTYIQKDKDLGTLYLVKYEDGSKLWAFEDSLINVE